MNNTISKTTKRCYYELLGIEKTSSSDDIKNAYRKRALQLHPDKNPSADAKELFQEINEAYNVLSDPNERTWYDNHRNQILSPDSSNTNEEQEFGLNIWPFFSTNCYNGFSDEATGFFAVYRSLFEKIKDIEQQAFNSNEEIEEENYEKPPGFGDSKTSYEKIAGFYAFWDNFSTYQSFAFADLYNPNEAENGKIKKLILIENKKERLKEKKNYIKIINSLVDFVRKRDPRYKEYLRVEKENEEKRIEDRRKAEEEKKKLKQEQRKMALEEELKRYKEEEEVKRLEEVENVTIEEVKGELEERDCYCEVCDKEFKTENQWKNHSQSKMHIKNMKDLLEEVGIGEEKEIVIGKGKKEEKKTKKKKKKRKNKENNEENNQNNEENNLNNEENNQNNKEINQKHQDNQFKEENQRNLNDLQENLDSNNEENSEEEINFQGFGAKKLKKTHDESLKSSPIPHKLEETKENLIKTEEIEEILIDNSKKEEEDEKKPGLNKAKLRKLKKKERVNIPEVPTKMLCNTCKEGFDTKNQLFKHLKATKHEQKKI